MISSPNIIGVAAGVLAFVYFTRQSEKLPNESFVLALVVGLGNVIVELGIKVKELGQSGQDWVKALDVKAADKVPSDSSGLVEQMSPAEQPVQTIQEPQ